MAPARQGDGSTVLYVGPDEDRTATVERALSGTPGFDVSTVTGAAAARDALDRTDVDCVVSAYALPDDDGVELLEAVRRERPELPFVLFPERGSEAVASRAMAAGVTDYVPANGRATADGDGTASDPIERLSERVRAHLADARDGRADDPHRRAIEAAREGIGVLDDVSRFQYVNDAFADIFGREPEALLGEHWSEFYPDDEVEWFMEEVYPQLTEEGHWHGEMTGLCADDTRFVAEKAISETTHGEIVMFARDPDDVRESDRRYRTLVDNLPGIVYRSRTDASWPFESVAGECEATTGYTASELCGDVDWEHEVMHPDDRAAVRSDVEAAIEADEPFEITYRIHTADGEVRWLWERGREVEPGVLEGFMTDVTDRKQRERELRETNEYLGAIIEASPAAIVAVDFEDGVEVWNPAAERIFGWSESEVLGEPLPFVDEDHRAEFDRIRAQLEAGEPVAGVETERVRKDGREISVNLSIAPLSDADGEVTGAMAAIQDVTDRKRRERELERTRDLLTEAERLADVGAWEWDVQTDDVTWTRGTRRLVEVSDGYEPTLESAIEFYHPEDRDTIRDLLEECRENGRFDGATLRIITAGGRERWIRTQGRAIESDGELRRVRGTVQDITERKRRDHQVAVLDRVLRHNLRTDVGEIVDRAETIAERADGPAADSASAIAMRGNELLTLANKHREVAKLLSEPQTVHEYDVPTMIDRVVDQMRETYPGAELSASLPPPVRVVTTSEIEEAVAELVENGVRHSDAETPAVEVSAEVEDDVVELRVADNGPGIPEEERQTIRSADDVDPLDHGSGMGLWLAKWTVSRAGGTMSFETSGSAGTVVRLRLPRTPVEPEPRREQAERDRTERRT